MKKIIGELLLSVMMVCFSALYFWSERIEAKAAATQEIIKRICQQQLCLERFMVNEVSELKDIHEIILEEANIEIEAINSIDDKKEWFLAYKSITNEYADFIDTPETIYDCFSEKELDLLFHVVQAEIGDGYSFEQKVNVASVIFNRIENERFPDSLEEILVENQFATISNSKYKEVTVSEETIIACEYAYQIEDTTDGCLFFDSNSRLNYEFMFFDGAHNFYTLKDEKKEGSDLILLQE